MRLSNKEDFLLGHYRVLDLTEEKGYLCGRILTGLGADVIKIEKPGSDPGRRRGPFYHLGQAFTFSRLDGEECKPAPCIGQDTEYVCTNILGMTDEEFVELLTSGVFE